MLLAFLPFVFKVECTVMYCSNFMKYWVSKNVFPTAIDVQIVQFMWSIALTWIISKSWILTILCPALVLIHSRAKTGSKVRIAKWHDIGIQFFFLIFYLDRVPRQGSNGHKPFKQVFPYVPSSGRLAFCVGLSETVFVSYSNLISEEAWNPASPPQNSTTIQYVHQFGFFFLLAV